MNLAEMMAVLTGGAEFAAMFSKPKWIGATKRTWLKAEKEFSPMFHGMQFSKTTTELKPKIEERAAKCEAEVEEWKKREASGEGATQFDRDELVEKAKQAQKTLLENAATLRMIARNLTATSYLLSLDELEYLGF